MELLQKWEKEYSELNEEYLRTKGMMTEREITECLLHLKSISAFIKDIQALHQPLVVWRSEQLFCDCSQGKGVDIDEDGFPYCIDCQKNIAK